MNELIKALRHFITRDIVYILGGSIVALSFLFLFDFLDAKRFGLILSNSETYSGWVLAPLMALGLGLMWVLGFMLQELFSLTPLVTTKPPEKVGRILGGFYRKFQNHEWVYLGQFDFEAARIEINENASEDSKAELQRIIMLKQVGTTLGACALTISLLFLVHIILNRTRVDIEWLIFSIVIGLILLIIGRVKLLEEIQYIYRLARKLRDGDSVNPT